VSLKVIPRNWARKGKAFAKADAFLVSLPKSGRTWLRFSLRYYLCALGGVPFSIDPGDHEPDPVPRLACSHDLWEHLTAPRLTDRLIGKYLIPPRARRRARFVIAVRDLRDVMVSLHLQLTRRGFRSGARFSGSLSELVRDRRFGAERSVDILNYWLDEWRDSGRCLVWSYEEAQKDPRASLVAVLGLLGIGAPDAGLVRESLDFASFDSMKQMEREDRFGRRLLQPGDATDPESFKVRRGRVGGWVDYLGAEDAERVTRAAARLRL
jgi:hypothetical protein